MTTENMNTVEVKAADPVEFIDLVKAGKEDEAHAYIEDRFGKQGTINFDEAGHNAFAEAVIAETVAQAAVVAVDTAVEETKAEEAPDAVEVQEAETTSEATN